MTKALSTTSDDPVFDKLEEATLGALADYMAYRAYAGSNTDYFKRARLGIPVLSTYGRVRGTRANERQLALLERRIASGAVDLPEVLALGMAKPALAAATEEEMPARTARGGRR